MTEEKLPKGPSKALTSIDFCTGETVVDKLISRITGCWHKTTAGIFELAHECADADDELSGHEKLSATKALIDRLPFDGATFSKLAAIGHDLRLQSLARLLPNSFTTLYELTQFDDDQLNAAIKAGAIHPRARRTQIQALRKPTRRPAELAPAVRDLTPGGRYEFMLPKDIDGHRFAQIKQALGALNKKFGVDIVCIREFDAPNTAVRGAISLKPGVSAGKPSEK